MALGIVFVAVAGHGLASLSLSTVEHCFYHHWGAEMVMPHSRAYVNSWGWWVGVNIDVGGPPRGKKRPKKTN